METLDCLRLSFTTISLWLQRCKEEAAQRQEKVMHLFRLIEKVQEFTTVLLLWANSRPIITPDNPILLRTGDLILMETS